MWLVSKEHKTFVPPTPQTATDIKREGGWGAGSRLPVVGSQPWLHSEHPGPGLRTLDPDPSLARPSCVTLGNALRVYFCIYQMGETRVLEGIVTTRMKDAEWVGNTKIIYQHKKL